MNKNEILFINCETNKGSYSEYDFVIKNCILFKHEKELRFINRMRISYKKDEYKEKIVTGSSNVYFFFFEPCLHVWADTILTLHPDECLFSKISDKTKEVFISGENDIKNLFLLSTVNKIKNENKEQKRH